ncbi:Membrane alanine aminopeptidase N [hydrothermal vent metagenome]|uniref:Membrane alanine aminopeptidase N n=1 Tax=hydrothermal vent metagenome TaxID=652676 RepID=A0A3B0U4Y7_9ZZZZ
MTKQMHYLKDYKPFPYAISSLEMRIEIAPEKSFVSTKLTIEAKPETKTGAELSLNGEELELLEIRVNGADLSSAEYEFANDRLRIFQPPEKSFELETKVALEPETNTSLMGLYRSNKIWCTQCEAEGFRRISFMADRPDVMTRYRVRLEADKKLAPVLLSNGNLIETGELSNGRHYAVWDDPHPKPSYLFAMVAGDLDVLRDRFITASKKKVDLAIYSERGKKERCAYAMDALKRAMKWDEERFGRQYDLDVFNIVAVSDFNFGAMENKGLNIFNDKYILADPDSATDIDYYNIERIVAHEYFHNWTGNRITCRDWFQLCLKEGLTVYRDQEFTSDMRSREVKRIKDARDLRTTQFLEDSGPLAHPPRPDHYAQIDNFYTATVYNKGAEVVRMLATLFGRKGFKKAMDLYFERHDGQATTIEKFLEVFQDSCGRDLSQFSLWYTQAGTPEISASGKWDQQNKTYRLSLKQKTAPTPDQSEKQALYIPIKFALVGPNGKDMEWEKVSGGIVENDLIIVDKNEVELVFKGLANRPIPSLLRQFSAPVKLVDDLSEEEQFFLARHDSDPFNRWQGLQSIASSIMSAAVRADMAFDAEQVDSLATALGDMLKNENLDAEFKALALNLPGEKAIARALGKNIEPEKISLARRKLLHQISNKLGALLGELYHTLGDNDDPGSQNSGSQDIEQVQNRALRNQCLMMMVAAGDRQSAELAARQYYGGANMSEKMAALDASVAFWSGAAEQMLEHFGASATSDPLIYDKWLSLSATRPDQGALERVKQIYNSPGFPKTNPNRVRSLIGSFAMNNKSQFARKDGQGFEFVAAVCQEIDQINPQLAAKILSGFADWADLEANRGQLAKQALQKLARTSPLSPTLSDILKRTLAG